MGELIKQKTRRIYNYNSKREIKQTHRHALADKIMLYAALPKGVKWVKQLLAEQEETANKDTIFVLYTYGRKLFSKELAFIRNTKDKEEALQMGLIAAYEAVKRGALLSEAIKTGIKEINKYSADIKRFVEFHENL